MMTSWPACVSSYPATNPASPAPIMRILLAGAACGSGLGTKLQPCCDAQCAEAADAPSFRKARRSMGMDTAYYSGCQDRSEEHTSELQSHHDLVCRLLLEKKKKT